MFDVGEGFIGLVPHYFEGTRGVVSEATNDVLEWLAFFSLPTYMTALAEKKEKIFEGATY